MVNKILGKGKKILLVFKLYGSFLSGGLFEIILAKNISYREKKKGEAKLKEDYIGKYVNLLIDKLREIGIDLEDVKYIKMGYQLIRHNTNYKGKAILARASRSYGV